MAHEADEPNAVVGLFDADGLTSEDLAEIDFPPIEADATAGRHGNGLLVERIVDVRQGLIGLQATKGCDFDFLTAAK
jgi:hypothetical protein